MESVFQVICHYRDFKMKEYLYLHEATLALERLLPLELLVHKSTHLESDLGPNQKSAHLKLCDQVVKHLGPCFSLKKSNYEVQMCRQVF